MEGANAGLDMRGTVTSEDAEYYVETTKLAKQQILSQASMAMLARQINQKNHTSINRLISAHYDEIESLINFFKNFKFFLNFKTHR